MAFQSMISGAECSTSVNPLSQLLKHSERDPTLRHDASLINSHPNSIPSIRENVSRSNGTTNQEFEQFHSSNPGNLNPFGVEALRREIHAVPLRNGSPQSISNDWLAQYPVGHVGPGPEGTTFQDLQDMESAFHRPSANGEPTAWSQAYRNLSSPSPLPPAVPLVSNQTSYRSTYGGGMSGYRSYPLGSLNYAPVRPMTTTDLKGKGKLVELDEKDWEAQFAKISNSEPLETATVPPAFTVNEDSIEDELNVTDEELLKNLESTWKNLSSTLNSQSMTEKELADWEAQYGSKLAEENDPLYDYGGDDLLSAQTKLYDMRDLDATLANPPEYPFTEQSEKFLKDFKGDPFLEGQRLLAQGAPLTEVATAFEAAVRDNVNRGEAWLALGDTLAADEKELRAIVALQRATSCGGEGVERAWMSLAISYVNEGEELRALTVLERWLSLTYPSIAENIEQRPTDPTDPWSASRRITDLFLEAARTGPVARIDRQGQETVDPDVQIGLGVLFYSNSDYNFAKDCFEAALTVRPNDFVLWNRLGATLANGGSPEEAIDAYRKALELRPTFTRAIYNLGVSCLNINCFHEAAEHLLAALELHRTGKGTGTSMIDGLDKVEDGSDTLWNTLRRAFLCMDRHDLAERARPGADIQSFRADGFDF